MLVAPCAAGLMLVAPCAAERQLRVHPRPGARPPLDRELPAVALGAAAHRAEPDARHRGRTKPQPSSATLSTSAAFVRRTRTSTCCAPAWRPALAITSSAIS